MEGNKQEKSSVLANITPVENSWLQSSSRKPITLKQWFIHYPTDKTDRETLTE